MLKLAILANARSAARRPRADHPVELRMRGPRHHPAADPRPLRRGTGRPTRLAPTGPLAAELINWRRNARRRQLVAIGATIIDAAPSIGKFAVGTFSLAAGATAAGLDCLPVGLPARRRR